MKTSPAGSFLSLIVRAGAVAFALPGPCRSPEAERGRGPSVPPPRAPEGLLRCGRSAPRLVCPGGAEAGSAQALCAQPRPRLRGAEARARGLRHRSGPRPRRSPGPRGCRDPEGAEAPGVPGPCRPYPRAASPRGCAVLRALAVGRPCSSPRACPVSQARERWKAANGCGARPRRSEEAPGSPLVSDELP